MFGRSRKSKPYGQEKRSYFFSQNSNYDSSSSGLLDLGFSSPTAGPARQRPNAGSSPYQAPVFPEKSELLADPCHKLV